VDAVPAIPTTFVKETRHANAISKDREGTQLLEGHADELMRALTTAVLFDAARNRHELDVI
jgi:hypothetical protein